MQEKLECTEELGDLIAQVDSNMALSVYLRANAAEKVVNSFSARGEFDKMVAYASKVSLLEEKGGTKQLGFLRYSFPGCWVRFSSGIVGTGSMGLIVVS